MRLSKDSAMSFVIVLFALTLRLIRIDYVPLYGDELTMVYDIYSIWETGKDQTGQVLPINFTMGEGRPPGYIYASLPFVAIFGPTALGVRMLSALSGAGIAVLMYFLGIKFFNRRVGLVAAILASISIWDINLSRAGFEAHFALFAALAGITLFVYSSKKPLYLILSGLAFFVAMHTYPTYKITVPILVLILALFHFKARMFLHKPKLTTILFAVIIIFSFSLVIFLTLTSTSEQRFFRINAFNQVELRKNIIEKINYERSITALPRLVEIVFHNKFLEYGYILTEGYLRNFSLDFLFIHGDRNPRHNMSEMGEFYFIEIITIFLGALIGFKSFKKVFIVLGLWILTAPMPATILLEPHVLRNSLMLPPLLLLSAVGVVTIWGFRHLKFGFAVLIFLIVGFGLQLIFVQEKLIYTAPHKFEKFWSASAKQASMMAIVGRDKYDYIFLSDRIDSVEFAYPVYSKFDPGSFHRISKSKAKVGDFTFLRFDNVYIGNIPPGALQDFLTKTVPGGKILYVGKPDDRAYNQNMIITSGKDMESALSYIER